MKVKNYLFFIGFLCTSFMAFAQPIRVSFDEFPQREFKNPSFTRNANLRTEATPLTLPFWEDFSDTANLVNHFKPNTGIYFNNHLCLNQPSINVATFDGLDGKGKKYNSSYVFQMDIADSLVSLDIDISSLSKKDSLYFSFQYQLAGYGEVPDQQIEGDSLVLQFYTKAGTWKSVWRSDFKTATDTSVFYPVLLKVTDSVFFHSNFKFKFFNYARLSGMFDLWHVDYVVMDTIKAPNNNREIKDGRMYFSDVAISKSPSSIIEPYQSIPANHLSNNLPFKNFFNFSLSSLTLNPLTGIEPFYSFQTESNSEINQETIIAITPKDINPGFLSIEPKVTSSLTPYSKDFILTTKVFISELITPTSNYQFQKNDTAISTLAFRNYYAYDDGEYEYGVRFDQVNALQAVRYDTYVSDTITHIDMCIPPLGFNIQGIGFLMKIWEDNLGKPGKEIYSHRDTVKYYPDIKSAPYSNGLNPFTRYAIVGKTIIIPKGVFYIGFKQLSGNSKAIRLGFDSNNDNRDKFWYDNDQGNGWSQYRNLKGSMMIRPVFANGAKDYTNKKIGDGQFKLEIYPNPNNTDILTLNDTFDNVRIYDQTGRLRLSYDSVEKIDISSLEAGFFFVKAIINGSVHTLQLIRAQK